MKNLSPCFASGSSCSTAAHFWMWWHALVENPERLRGMVDNRTTLCKKEKLFSLLTCILLAETVITSHQGISWPSHAKNLPLSLFLTLSMMERSFCTENSLVKSLSLGTFLWKGRERSLSTVPGCSRMQVMLSFLPNSTDTVFVTAWHEQITSGIKPCQTNFYSCTFTGLFKDEMVRRTLHEWRLPI